MARDPERDRRVGRGFVEHGDQTVAVDVAERGVPLAVEEAQQRNNTARGFHPAP